jgi:hypothetical protein
MLVVHVVPTQVGVELGANGNPCVFGADPEHGQMVRIEFSPEGFKAFLKNAQRVKGIGIAQAGLADIIEVGGRGGNGG